jgi:hypothetical protein
MGSIFHQMKGSLCGKESGFMARLRDRIIDFIYRTATMREEHHGLLTVFGGLFFSGVVLFIIFLALLSDKLLGLHAWPPSPANLILSIPLLAAGIWLWLWSVLIFIKSRGTAGASQPAPKAC